MRKSVYIRVSNVGVAVLFALAGVVFPLLPPRASAAVANVPFTETSIEVAQPSWGKQIADLDGDGAADLIEGGGYVGDVYWYKAPSWTKYRLGDNCGNGDDVQVADVNGDGALDVLSNNTMCWLENPRGSGGNVQGIWTYHSIDATVHTHDLLAGDVSGDGKTDVVGRGTGEFGPTFLYIQGANADSWTKVPMPNAPIGQGTGLADINRDGRVDIVGNGYWLAQPSDPVAGSWVRHDFTAWTQGASVVVNDMNNDGRPDVFIAPSEAGVGQLAWFENPTDPVNGTWVRHDIGQVDDVHRFHVVDVNKDGRRDVVFAEMHQSPTRRVGIFLNEGGGLAWTLQVLSTNGSHNIAVGDVGSDGDVDILGANWHDSAPDGAALKLWRNDLSTATTPNNFSYIQVDDARTESDFGLTYGDMNNDGRKDIISSQYWYKNPGGNMTGTWTRTNLGVGKDAMLTLDVDYDGQLDIIAQTYDGATTGVHWLKPTNAAATSFTTTQIGSLPLSADHKSQGYATTQIIPGGNVELVFSTDAGYFYFSVPSNPAVGNWPRVQASTEGRQEGLAVGDINADGKVDVVGSTDYSPSTVAWWSNPGTGAGNWTKNVIGTLPLETTQLKVADINNDGRMDVVATDDDLGAQVGHIYWFERTATGTWIQHAIATAGSLESLDVGDFTADGKVDIVTGDHKKSGGTAALETAVWENVGGGTSWTKHLVDTGKESHIGTQVTDLDSDGDLDFASIAWTTSSFLHLWRNDNIIGGGAPDLVAPVITGVATLSATGASASVTWVTDEPADSQIEYGTTTAYGNTTALAPAMVTAHNHKIAGLQPNTTYHYRVLSKDTSGNASASGDFTFSTVEATAVVHLQTAGTTDNSGNQSISQAFAAQNSAGSLIVAAASWGAGGTLTCSDTRGNTYTTVTTQYDSTKSQSLGICYAADITGGANTVTATFGEGGAFRRLLVHEYSGIAAVSPVDVSSMNNTNGSTAANAITSGIATTTVPGDLIFGAVMDDNGTNNITAGTGFTQRNSVNNKDLATQDMLQTTAGPVASTQTFSAANRYLAHMVAFKPAHTTPPGPDVTAPAISGVAAASITTTSAAISWATNEPADTQVEYGTTTAYGMQTVLNPALSTTHSAGLSGLAPSTLYHYRVVSKDAAGNVATSGDFTFTTNALPPPDTTPPTVFLVESTAVTANSATINWVTDEPADGQVEYGPTTAYGAATNLAAAVTLGHSFSLTGLLPGTTYHYRVLSKDAAGNLTTSNDFTFTTNVPDTTAPAITAVGNSNVTQSTATITWTTDEPADSQIEYGLTPAFGSVTPLNAALVTAHSVNLSSLTPNTTYHYRVLSKDAAGNAASSAPGSFTTATTPPPAAVAHVQSAATTSNGGAATMGQAFATPNTAGNMIVAAFSWGENSPASCSDTQGNTYVLATTQYDSTKNQSLGICYAANIKAGANTVTVTFGGAFRRLIIHEYSGIAAVNPVDVTAKNNANGSTAANAITSTAATTTVPGALIFGATMDDADTTTITAGTGFTQRNSVNNKDLVTQDMVQTTAGPVASTMTFGAADRYLAHMVAFKPAAVTPDTTPPVVSGVAATNITTTSAALTWATNEPADTQVEYGTTAAYGTVSPLVSALTTAHTVNLSDLTPNTAYHYRVLSKDAAGNLTTSGDFTFTTQALPPPDTTPPTVFFVTTANVTTTSATVLWSTDEPADTQVEYGLTTAYGNTTPLSTVFVTAHNVALSDLTPNTTYHYRVLSKDAAGNAAVSDDFTFTTQALPPPDTTAPAITAVTSSSVTQNSATIAWTTDEPADRQVHYGLTTAYGSSTPVQTTLNTSHNVVLAGLTPNTTYHYRVLSKDAAGNMATSGDFTLTTQALPPASPITHKQTANITNNGASTTVSRAFTSANAVGNFIAVAVSWGNSATFSCSDTQGNVYAMATTAYDSSNGQSLGICYAPNIKAGANTVKVTFSSSASHRRLIIHEYSGIAVTSPVDVTAKNIANGTTGSNAITSTAATTTVPGALIFGATMDDTWVTSVTAGTGFTQRNSVNNKDLVTQDRVQATAGPVASTMTFGTAHRYLAHMVAFKPAP